MRQLSDLIEQAKKQRGLNDLFNTQAEPSDLRSQRKVETTEVALMSKLDELEVQLFPCLHLPSNHRNEIIKTLESVMDDL